jgi:hypothetical protein
MLIYLIENGIVKAEALAAWLAIINRWCYTRLTFFEEAKK